MRISLNLIKEEDLVKSEMFRCFSDGSHLVEDPIYCKTCEQIYCAACYLKNMQCLCCNNLTKDNYVVYPNDFLAPLQKIRLKCENCTKGCSVEIEYANYPKHIKECNLSVEETGQAQQKMNQSPQRITLSEKKIRQDQEESKEDLKKNTFPENEADQKYSEKKRFEKEEMNQIPEKLVVEKVSIEKLSVSNQKLNSILLNNLEQPNKLATFLKESNAKFIDLEDSNEEFPLGLEKKAFSSQVKQEVLKNDRRNEPHQKTEMELEKSSHSQKPEVLREFSKPNESLTTQNPPKINSIIDIETVKNFVKLNNEKNTKDPSLQKKEEGFIHQKSKEISKNSSNNPESIPNKTVSRPEKSQKYKPESPFFDKKVTEEGNKLNKSSSNSEDLLLLNKNLQKPNSGKNCSNPIIIDLEKNEKNKTDKKFEELKISLIKSLNQATNKLEFIHILRKSLSKLEDKPPSEIQKISTHSAQQSCIDEDYDISDENLNHLAFKNFSFEILRHLLKKRKIDNEGSKEDLFKKLKHYLESKKRLGNPVQKENEKEKQKDNEKEQQKKIPGVQLPIRKL